VLQYSARLFLLLDLLNCSGDAPPDVKALTVASIQEVIRSEPRLPARI